MVKTRTVRRSPPERIWSSSCGSFNRLLRSSPSLRTTTALITSSPAREAKSVCAAAMAS